MCWTCCCLLFVTAAVAWLKVLVQAFRGRVPGVCCGLQGRSNDLIQDNVNPP